MSDLQDSINYLFSTSQPPHDWTPEEEREVIARAQDGDQAATQSLLVQYAAAMKAGIQFYRRSLSAHGADFDLEETRQNAALGVLEAIAEFDPAKHERLAALAQAKVRASVLGGANTEKVPMRIPKRSLTRFFRILREAEGDVQAAAELAPAYSMAPETFMSILASVRGVVSYDSSATGYDDSDSEESILAHMDATSLYGLARSDTEIVEDDMLVRVAFDAVDTQEEEVIRHSYGFNDYDVQSDAEVAHRLGLSRPKVQRVRAGGLAKMRNALGVA